MSDLEKTGVSLVVENADQSMRQLNGFNKALAQTDQALTGVSKSRVLGELNNQLGQLGKNALANVPGLSRVSGALSNMGLTAGTATTALAGLAGAVAIGAAGWAAFISLGKRGAELQGTLNAFGNITTGILSSTEVLEQLRQQTRGTISDFELMRLTILALQGTSQGFRDVVAPNIGSIIDVTNRVAQATGQSAEIVRQKFLLGLRRQSKLLLDDVGVSVDKTSARFQELSATIGAEAAYAQIAIEDLKRVGGELGAVNTVQEALLKPMVLLRNVMDQLALAVQPVFAPLATLVGSVTDKLAQLAGVIMPIVAAGFQVIGGVISSVFSVASAIYRVTLGPVFDNMLVTLTYVAAAASLAADAITAGLSYAAAAINSVIGSIADTFGRVRDRIFGDTEISLTELGAKLAKGGGQIIGSFAAGLARGATAVVNVVTQIAQIVADFLQGFSPPKKGPLSKIDQGGANVIQTWAEGMLRGFVNPADRVADIVNDRLGSIATMSLAQVDARLRQLDIAVQPFVDQLDIAKADFEAITGFADPAIEALKRLQAAALKQSDLSAALAYDRQIGQLSELHALEQERVDQAQVQLAFAQAQQVQERALLAIQRKRVEALGGVIAGGGAGDAAAKALAGGTTAPKKKGGGGAEDLAGMPPVLGGGKAPDLLGGGAVAKAKQELIKFGATLGENFADGFTETTEGAFADFSVARGGLDAQLARIKAADPVGKLQARFSGLADIFTGPLSSIETTFNDYFGADGKIATAVKSLFEGGGVFGPVGIAVTAITSLFGSDGTLAQKLNETLPSLDTFRDTVRNTLSTLFSGISTAGVSTALQGLLDSTLQIPGTLSVTLKDRLITRVTEGLTQAATSLGGVRVSDLTDRWESLIKRGLEIPIGIAATLAERIQTRVKEGLDQAQTLLSNLIGGDTFTKASDEIEKIVNGLMNAVGSITDTDIDVLLTPIRTFINGLNEILKTLDFGLIDAVKSGYESIKGLLGGGDEDTPAMSTGEAIAASIQQAMKFEVTLPEGVSLPAETITRLNEAGIAMMGHIAEGMKSEAGLGAVNTALLFLTGEEGVFGAAGPLALGLQALFGPEGSFGLLLTAAGTAAVTFQETVTSALQAVAATFDSTFVSPSSPFQTVLPTLDGIFTAIVEKFQALAGTGEGSIGGALAALGTALSGNLVQPFVDAINAIFTAIEEAFAALRQSTLAAFLGAVGIVIPEVGIPRIRNPLAAASGGFGLRGPTLVGEKGPELVNFRRPANVFPAAVTRAFTQMLAQPQPLMVPGGAISNTYNNQRSTTNHINVGTPQDALLMMRQLEASY